jgi:tetratricopeptide (TPR) repeat protein
MVADPWSVLPYGLIVLALLAATGVALVRWPLFGFVGACYFVILSPTSSFIPIIVSPVGEHRVYLPLAAFLTLLVLGIHRFAGKRFWIVIAVLTVGWGTLTYLRNEDYWTSLTLWRSTMLQCPGNARAHNNYGVALIDSKRLAEAEEQFQTAASINPNYSDAQYNWGNALLQEGRGSEAIDHYREALRLKPNFSGAQNNWGNALEQLGRPNDALEHYQDALQLDPMNPEVRYNLGNTLLKSEKYTEALAQLQQALQIDPNIPDAHNTLGIVLYHMGHKPEAITEFQTALRLNPNFAPARENLSKLGAAEK